MAEVGLREIFEILAIFAAGVGAVWVFFRKQLFPAIEKRETQRAEERRKEQEAIRDEQEHRQSVTQESLAAALRLTQEGLSSTIQINESLVKAIVDNVDNKLNKIHNNLAIFSEKSDQLRGEVLRMKGLMDLYTRDMSRREEVEADIDLLLSRILRKLDSNEEA